jgi:hypothetical protein
MLLPRKTYPYRQATGLAIIIEMDVDEMCIRQVEDDLLSPRFHIFALKV